MNIAIAKQEVSEAIEHAITKTRQQEKTAFRDLRGDEQKETRES